MASITWVKNWIRTHSKEIDDGHLKDLVKNLSSRLNKAELLEVLLKLNMDLGNGFPNFKTDKLALIKFLGLLYYNFSKKIEEEPRWLSIMIYDRTFPNSVGNLREYAQLARMLGYDLYSTNRVYFGKFDFLICKDHAQFREWLSENSADYSLLDFAPLGEW